MKKKSASAAPVALPANVVRSSETCLQILLPTGGAVVTVENSDGITPADEAAARLLASATGLLAACRGLLTDEAAYQASDEVYPYYVAAAVERIAAVVAKATGN